MRTEVLRYLKDITRTNVLPQPIVDFGGLIVNEQKFEFSGAISQIVGEHKTFDILPEADLQGDIHNTLLPDASIGTALLLETLEHLAYPQTAFNELHRILIPSGLLIVTTLMCWEEHRFPCDYWRFLPDGILHLFTSSGFYGINIVTDNLPECPSGIFAFGRKS